ncbi:Mavicyanin like [Actinidia chinensis var. chinensis]|uniref:Mavicyanin like n=1 Tax=Actinidia chinensis var. chinensis TaxID=1590841 RepID=A0A2R6PK31_ACTCC|nr:Mavicyanin like [Actinidia chinensis var. chinensis]
MGFSGFFRALALVAIFGTLFVSKSMAVVYKVGDSTGWTTIGNFDYKQWAATKTFQIGDVIRFEYNPQFHNVMQVTHPEYRSCNTSAPIATHTTGNDSITITANGHHFFLCGVPGHCQSGQKVDINVLRAALVPSPSVSPTPPTPDATVPAPPPSGAATLDAMAGLHGMLGFSMAVFAAFV